MKKLLCVLLCAVMLCCTLSVAAIAATAEKIMAVTYASVDIAAPVVGQMPSYNATSGETGYKLDSSYFESNAYQNGIGWYDITAGKEVLPTEAFQEGHAYRVTVSLVIESGYIFDENMKIRINDSYVPLNYVATFFVTGELEFPALNKETPSNTTVTYAFADVDAPVAGQMPSYNATHGGTGYVLDTTGYNTNFFQNGVGWYDVTANENVLYSETFKPGHMYEVTIFFVAKEGYSFAENVEIQINGKEATIVASASTYVVAELAFPAMTGEIDFAFADIAAPAIGQTPSHEANYGGNGYVLDSSLFQGGVGWYDVTTGENILTAETFKPGHVYKVTIFFVAEEGYSFAEDMEIQINGEDATVRFINTSLVIGELEFPALVSEIDFAFADIAGPAAGQTPSYNANHGGTGYVLDAGSNNPNYYKNGVGWFDVTENYNVPISKTFVAGHEYKVMIYFKAKEGYSFTEDVEVQINGQDATVTYFSETSIMGELDFPRLPGSAACDGGEGCPSARFIDVKPSDWFHEAVDYAVANGLFGGMSENTFEPNTAMTRAMLVTVLWRYEGSPAGGSNTFTDVPNDQWYTQAVAWAAANGIVGGVGNNRFDPNGKITREQMATILYRYASGKGIDTSARANLSGFPDAGSVSSYASDAISWAVAEGLINGSDGKLMPQGNATRAQVATILMRFIEG